ncbi:hypothetical protein ACK25U_12310 [Ectopseudomonas mendocina]
MNSLTRCGGVAYEGVILASLVGIFLFTSERIEENRREKYIKLERQKSRDSLLKILSLLCEAYHTGGAFHWTKHVKYAPSFEASFQTFQEAKKRKYHSLAQQLKNKEFKNSCEQNMPTMYSLISVAEKLSPAHLDAWIGICSLVSLTVTEGLEPELILIEFEEFMLDFSKAKV